MGIFRFGVNYGVGRNDHSLILSININTNIYVHHTSKVHSKVFPVGAFRFGVKRNYYCLILSISTNTNTILSKVDDKALAVGDFRFCPILGCLWTFPVPDNVY